MPYFDFIPTEEYRDAPEEKPGRFLHLEAIAQKRLAKVLDQASGNISMRDQAHAEFVQSLIGLAEACGINGLPAVSNSVTGSVYDGFQSALAGVVTRLRSQSGDGSDVASVPLQYATKARIRLELARLRNLVDAAPDLSSDQKAALLEKIAALETELDRRRLRIRETLATVASIATILGGCAAVDSDASHFYGEIVRLIGHDKHAEEEDQRLLPPPPRQLPGPMVEEV